MEFFLRTTEEDKVNKQDTMKHCLPHELLEKKYLPNKFKKAASQTIACCEGVVRRRPWWSEDITMVIMSSH